MDPTFLGALSQVLPGIKTTAVLFIYSHPADAKGHEHREAISFAHQNPQQFDSREIIVDCDDPETLKKVLKALEAFTERGEKK